MQSAQTQEFTLIMGGGFYQIFLRGLLVPYRKNVGIRDVKFHNYNSDKSRNETRNQYDSIFVWIFRSTLIFI